MVRGPALGSEGLGSEGLSFLRYHREGGMMRDTGHPVCRNRFLKISSHASIQFYPSGNYRNRNVSKPIPVPNNPAASSINPGTYASPTKSRLSAPPFGSILST